LPEKYQAVDSGFNKEKYFTVSTPGKIDRQFIRDIDD